MTLMFVHDADVDFVIFRVQEHSLRAFKTRTFVMQFQVAQIRCDEAACISSEGVILVRADWLMLQKASFAPLRDAITAQVAAAAASTNRRSQE